MTKEIYESLKQYESHLTTAVKCDFARNISKEGFINLNNAFKALFGKDSSIGNGCGKCGLRDLKRIGVEYFKYKEALQKKMEKARKAKELNNDEQGEG